jgi:TonB family protein
LVKVVPDLGMRSVAVRNGETVEAVALIDASGNVYDVQVLHSKNVALSTKNAVITAVRQWKFSPALANGVAVRSRAPIKFTFSR